VRRWILVNVLAERTVPVEKKKVHGLKQEKVNNKGMVRPALTEG
jgi:hypothetical protein